MRTEKEIRRSIREELRLALVKYKTRLDEQKEEDVDFKPEESGLSLPKGLQRLLDPDLSPQKFASLDSQLDDSGKPAHQAIAIAVFALNYSDNDEDGAKKIMMKAIQALPKLVKAKSEESEAK
jgi:hypothetical protein